MIITYLLFLHIIINSQNIFIQHKTYRNSTGFDFAIFSYLLYCSLLLLYERLRSYNIKLLFYQINEDLHTLQDLHTRV